jgi:hypothetical protein
MLGKAFPKEITKVTKDNKHEVADVCRDQNVVRRFFYLGFSDSDGVVGVVLRNAAITFVCAVTKLGVNGP